MLLVALFDVALTVLGWFLGLFDFMPTLDLPAAPSVVVPVPLLGAGGVSILTAWFGTAVGVSVALVFGKALQWLYSLIPFKMT